LLIICFIIILLIIISSNCINLHHYLITIFDYVSIQSNSQNIYFSSYIFISISRSYPFEIIMITSYSTQLSIYLHISLKISSCIFIINLSSFTSHHQLLYYICHTSHIINGIVIIILQSQSILYRSAHLNHYPIIISIQLII
jgi:energy-coupling factor transporter transmembrane protein EcfT